MVLCLLRASYNVTIADTDAVFLSDASSWLSGFDLVASRAAPKSTPYTARLFDGVGVDATRTNTPSQVAGQLPRVVFGKMGRLTLFRTGALQHGRPRNFINQASGGKDSVAPGRSAGRELRAPRGQYKWVRETSDGGAAPLLFATSSSIAAGFTRKATVGLLPHGAFVRDCSVDTRGAVVVHCASASHSADAKREALERASAWALRDDWRDVAAGPDASAYLRSLSRTYTVPLGKIFALLKHTIN